MFPSSWTFVNPSPDMQVEVVFYPYFASLPWFCSQSMSRHADGSGVVSPSLFRLPRGV